MKAYLLIVSMLIATLAVDGNRFSLDGQLFEMRGIRVASATGNQAYTDSLMATALNAQGTFQTSVTQGKVTWTFAEPALVGQYANGDWWVQGPVSIISISPESVDEAGWIQHGTVVDPVFSLGPQGFDSSMSEGGQGPKYSAALNVDPGITTSPLNLTTGTVVKSISRADTPAVRGAGSRPQLQGMEYLTVVSAVPAPNSFRPPPGATDKTSYWTVADLDYSILKSHKRLAGAPSLSTVERWIEKPWPSFITDNQGRWIHPRDNMSEYGRDLGRKLGNAGLVLHSDYSEAEKEQLYIRLVQIGIDTHYTVRQGGIFTGFGAINTGWKWPVVLAGLALDDPDIKAAAASFSFSFDRQTWYVDESDVGRPLYTKDGRQRDEYITSDVGKAEWGEQHWKQKVRDGRNWNASYRNIAFAGSFSGILSAIMTEGGREAWNWDATFDYMDRAYLEYFHTKVGDGVNNPSDWEDAMYDAYRTVVSNSPMDTWALEHGLAAGLDATYDSDKDGLPLLLEFALGTSPIKKSVSPVYVEQINGNSVLHFPRTQSSLSYLVEQSSDLSNWTSEGIIQGTKQAGEMDHATVTTPSSDAALYLRLRVEE
jgi:hypothetical protein